MLVSSDEDFYLVTKVSEGQPHPIMELHNQDALYSIITKYFTGSIEHLDVFKLDPQGPPYLNKLSEEKLRAIYDNHGQELLTRQRL